MLQKTISVVFRTLRRIVCRRRALIEDMFDAASTGEHNEVERLLVRGVDANEQDGEGRTPLILAALHGGYNSLHTTRCLLDRGAEIDFRWRGAPALHHAISRGAVDVVKVLLAYGADPKGRTDKGETTFNWVATTRALFEKDEQARREHLAMVSKRYGSPDYDDAMLDRISRYGAAADPIESHPYKTKLPRKMSRFDLDQIAAMLREPRRESPFPEPWPGRFDSVKF